MTLEPTSPADAAPATPVVLFDGVCNLCNGWVRWVIDRDPDAVFRFASLQSQAARDAIRRAAAGGTPDSLPDSIVLVDAEGLHTESDAVLRIFGRLGFPYALLGMGRAVPRPVRNAFYRLVATHRYRWFGRRETCAIPTPGIASRFLDTDAR